MTEALCRELTLQKDYIGNDEINTIYFGGGTPSLLNQSQIAQLLGTARSIYRVSAGAEVTLEANPDDLTQDKLAVLRGTGVNRLSIGVQSFHEATLKFLNRAHNSEQAIRCIADARQAGFSNLSIDLIYAIPSDDHQLWKKDLEQAIALQPEHISSYSLTIEPGTAFGSWLKKGKLHPAGEEYAAEQFEILVEELTGSGYEQYEVSNFCKPDYYSRHNSSYWKQEVYLGIGPGAHSYNGTSRQFNISHNPRYMKALGENTIPCEREMLSRENQVNEYLLTTLRTRWGSDLTRLETQWGYDIYALHKDYLEQLFSKKYAIIENDHLKLTRSGLLLADQISADLFTEEHENKPPA